MPAPAAHGRHSCGPRPKRGGEQAGASGARSRRAVSAPRTISARKRRGSCRWRNPSIIVSKVQSRPRWLQNVHLRCRMESRRSVRRPLEDLLGATNRKTRVRIDEAADRARDRRCGRSSAGRGSPRRCGPWCRRGDERRSRRAASRCSPGFEAAFEDEAGMPQMRSQAAAAMAELQAVQKTMTVPAARQLGFPMLRHRRWPRRSEPGIGGGLPFKNLGPPHIDDMRDMRPSRSDEASFSTEIYWERRMSASRIKIQGTRFFGMSPCGEIASPMAHLQ